MGKKKASNETDQLIADLNKMEAEVTVTAEEVENMDIAPPYASEQWSDYVMSKFTSDELDDGKPKVVGLRRVARTLLGVIKSSKPVSVQYIDGRAIVSWVVVIDMGDNGGLCEFGGAADGAKDNLAAETYSVFPTAMAEVRAEARALKRALQINVVSAEEIAPKNSENTPNITAPEMQDKISPVQIKFLSSRCNTLNIELNELIKQFGEYNSVEDLNREIASKLIALINDYQSGKVEIPQTLRKG